MATAETSTNQAEDQEKLREEWLERLSGLVETVRGWAQDLDWSTRQIEKKMEDSRLGTYKAPAILLQKETAEYCWNRSLGSPVSAPTIDKAWG